jgi:hypothetical protein
VEEFRLGLRVLIFLAATFVFAFVLWYVVLIVGIVLFESPTPECTDSDTCNTFGDVFYKVQDEWYARIAWLVLSGLLLAWPLRWLFRSERPVRRPLERSEGGHAAPR